VRDASGIVVASPVVLASPLSARRIAGRTAASAAHVECSVTECVWI
jgi:hypothetical protein